MLIQQIYQQSRTGCTEFSLYDRILSYYMTQYYDRISPCRTWRNTIVYEEKNGHIRSTCTESIYDFHFCSVYLTIRPCFSMYDTEISNHNTGSRSCNMTKYDRIRRTPYTSSRIAGKFVESTLHKLRNLQLVSLIDLMLGAAKILYMQ